MYIDKNGNKWFKGNLHTHTTVSDGRKTPDEAIKIYRENGYDFLALTDHWKFNETDENIKPLILSGIEYNLNGADVLRGVYHIVGIGMKENPDIANTEDWDAQTVIDKIHKTEGIAILAHPAWSLDTVEQILPYHSFDMTEIFNSVSDLPYNCRPYSGDVIDALAARNYILSCGAADDTHFYESETCRSYIYVKAEECTRDAILESIKKGDFYASQGPIIDYSVTTGVDAKTIHIEITSDVPVKAIVYFTATPWISNRSVSGENIKSADFTFTKKDKFVRVEVIDENGNRAFLSPIPFETV